ncbi:MAG: hypothetical protein OHK0013_02590 [Sandaracinaceae bacterium]
MKPQQLHHPLQSAIEDIYAAGHTPRLQIDARRKDVVVPDFIRRTWQSRLVIDLDPSYPLDLAYDALGISVDLAFQGQVSRCTLPWTAIYAVIDRSTGRGIVVEAHLPPAELSADEAWIDRAAKRPKLSAVPAARGEAAPKTEAPEAEAPKADGPRGEATKSDATKSDATKSDATKSGEASTEEAAKARRARFKVIDGGR